MSRAAHLGLLALDFLGFILRLILAFVFGDLFSKGGRIWLIPIFLCGAALIYLLIRLATP